MDVSPFSNLNYRRVNMFSEDPSAVLAKNIANVIPTIHHGIKRALHLNLKNYSQFTDGKVPSIEVIPPSPPAHEGIRKSFVAAKLDEVLHETFNVCRRYSMPHIPAHLGDNLHKDISRRSSMPAIPSKYLLQVPKPERKRRRRHSLPDNMQKARESLSSENRRRTQSSRSFDNSLENFNDRESDDGNETFGKVHEVFISGFINDKNEHEDSSIVYKSFAKMHFHEVYQNKPVRRKVNDGIAISNMADKVVFGKDMRFLITLGDSDNEESSTSSPKSDDTYVGLTAEDTSNTLSGERHFSLNEKPYSALTVPSQETEKMLSESFNKNGNIDDFVIRANSVNVETKSFSNDVDKPHLKYSLSGSGGHGSFDCSKNSGNQIISSPLPYSTTREEINYRNHNGLPLQIFNSNRDKDDSENKRTTAAKPNQVSENKCNCTFNTKTYPETIDCNHGVKVESESVSNDNCNTRNNEKKRDCCCLMYSKAYVTKNVNIDAWKPHDSEMNVIKLAVDTAPPNSIYIDRLNSLTVDHKSNVVHDKNYLNTGIVKEEFIKDRASINISTSDELINAKNRNNCAIVSKSTDVYHENKERRSSDIEINNYNILKRREKQHGLVKRMSNIEYDNDLDLSYFRETPDPIFHYDYDFESSPLEKSSSMSQIQDVLVRKKHRMRDFDRPVSFHEDAVNIDIYGGDNGASNLQENVATSLDEFENRNVYPMKKNRDFANTMFRKAVSLCELQNEKIKENFAKLEQKLHYNDSVSYPSEENTEEWFPRLSYEDCSSCASCRSKSSSYHSLLYDVDTASNYQIYQPTVCDVESVTTDEEKEMIETSKIMILKSKKEKFMKQSQDALGSLKDKFRKTKSNNPKI